MDETPTAKQRLLILTIYVVILGWLNALLTGGSLPSAGGAGLWFFSAIGLLFFTRLTSPFFAPPRDALATSTTVSLVLATVDLTSVASFQAELEMFRWITVGLGVATTLLAAASITLYRIDPAARPKANAVSRVAYRLANRLGRGQVAFTPPVLVSVLGFYQDNVEAQLWLLFSWTILVFTEPVELLLGVVRDIRAGTRKRHDACVGSIERVDEPSIIRVDLSVPATWVPHNLHIACLPDSRQVEVIPLFTQTQERRLIGTGLWHGDSPVRIADGTPGGVYRPGNGRAVADVLNELCGGVPADLVGFVVEGSSISTIRFEISRQSRLEEGTIVFARRDGESIFYQVLDGRTTEESFSQNPRGTHVASAAQLGVLADGAGFQKYGWLPAMNAPVFLPRDAVGAAADVAADDLVLGAVPRSKIPVRASIDDMLAYHTAILGVTGTGKTELAYEIVRRALDEAVKVVCVDLTGEYIQRLSDRHPRRLGPTREQVERLQDLLFDVEAGEFSAAAEKRALREFVNAFTPEIRGQVGTFLDAVADNLAIFELEGIANTRATLRITELYLSCIFEWARTHRGRHRVLLVLEEAHTTVPETSMFGWSDRAETGAAVSRMAQIALQGRKYDVGLLLISQRTALVSKTLLSQCNTVICFTMYDETGLKYLANVFSADHVSAIPNLKFLQGMAFGKAIRSDRPIIFEMPEDPNKRAKSEETKRHQPSGNNDQLKPAASVPAGESPTPEDDLPF